MAYRARTIRIHPSVLWRNVSLAAASAWQFTSFSVGAVSAAASGVSPQGNRSAQIMATHGRTFSFATQFLPAEYRDPTTSLYAFFRTLDDLVDEPQPANRPIARIDHELAAWESWFRGGLVGPAPSLRLGREIAPVCRQYRIPNTVFFDFLDGMRADLTSRTYSDRAAVEHYSYQVASTVGIAMAHVFGSASLSALDAASHLGIAMQLTNILRDIGGDLERGRVYLPVDLMEQHDLTTSDIYEMWQQGVGPDLRLQAVIRTMIQWSDDHYRSGEDGIALLPADVRMPILMAARLYQQILRQLEHNRYDSLRMRAATTNWQKIREAYRCAGLISRMRPRVPSPVEQTATSHGVTRRDIGDYAG